MRRLLRARPGLGRYALAFGEQGMMALLSLGVTLWLIRRGTAEQLGGYVFWANAVLVAGTLVSACSTVHLFRLPPGPGGRAGNERAILSAQLALTLLATAFVLAVIPVLGRDLGLWSAGLFLPGALIGLHARAVAASRGAMALSLLVSATNFAVVAGIILGEMALSLPPSVPLLLAANGVSQAVAGAWVIHRLSAPGAVRFGAASRRRWRVLARRSGWALLAGAGNEVFTRLYIFTVPAFFGPAALAGLAAGQIVLRPATLLAGAFGAAARGALAARRAAGDAAGFRRLLLLGAAGPAAVTLALGLLAALAWPWIARDVYGGRYEGLEPVVLLWAMQMALSCFWVAGLVGLQGLGRLRALALAEVGGALACAAAMPAGLVLLGPPGALAAAILGGVVQVALLARGIRRALRAMRHEGGSRP